MENKHKYLGIIPARAGSKGIKEKNMQLIRGKPLIRYTIEAAQGSEKLETFILTSNHDVVIKLARDAGIKVPFTRPDDISQDDTPMKDVVKHALKHYYDENGFYPGNIVLLQPTSPFRTGEDIDNAITRYEEVENESLISVCEAGQHPYDCLYITNGGKVNSFPRIPHQNESCHVRQDYPGAYYIDGAIYISATRRFLKEETFFDSDSAYYLMSRSHSIDIDEPFDLEIARALSAFKDSNHM